METQREHRLTVKMDRSTQTDREREGKREKYKKRQINRETERQTDKIRNVQANLKKLKCAYT